MSPSESLPAFRTEFKILMRFKSTTHTSSEKAPVSRLHLCQMLRQYFYILAACDPSSDLRVKGIDRIVACALYIVLLVPFETRDEEQRQIHIGHEYLIPAICAAVITDDGLIVFEILSSLRYAHYKKHLDNSPYI